jgi:glycosyltransferase involved in cell wall biosynthesis
MQSDGPKVVIFTTFSDISEAYSLNRVVQDQLNMLLSHGYNPTVIVAEGFVPKGVYTDERVTIKTIPNVPVHNEVKKDESFDSDVQAIYSQLKEILKDAQVVLTHDIIYQNAALKHNFAARRVAAELPSLKWLHWIHSATSPVTLANLRPYFTDEYINTVTKPFPNSFYIFFNDYSIPRIAHNFNVSEEVVRVVHHPSDLKEVYALTDDVHEFARKNNLYSADVICVYPIRLDRGKQVEMVIKTIAMLKEFELSVRLVVVDFHSTGGDKVTYRDELKAMAIDWGLNMNELVWTSEIKPEWKVEVPHADVMAFMRLVNVFIMPSVSESYSLVTQEAGLNKCIVVLNQDFPPFRDIFGPDAIFKKYSSNFDVMADVAEADGNTMTQYGPANASPEERKAYEKRYHGGTAGLIASKLRSYKDLAFATRLRKFRNLDFVFKHELEPLLFEEVK